MKYQNLLARVGEVSTDAIRRTLEELWTTPATKKDTFDLPEGATMDDLYRALRDSNTGKGSVQRQVESMVSGAGFGLKGATPEEFYVTLKDAVRRPEDAIWDYPGWSGWPRLLSDKDREDYLRTNLEGYGNGFTRESQVDTGVEGKTVALYDLVTPDIPVETGQNPPASEGNQSPLFDPAKIRQVSDQRKVNIPHQSENPVDTTETIEDDDFPGETIVQAVGRIRYALGLYPTAPKYGPAGPHPGLCRGNPEGCEVCGFTKDKTDHCHRYEVCGDCLGFGDASCGTAVKMDEFAREEGLK